MTVLARRFTVRIDGHEASDELYGTMAEIRVRQSASRPAAVEVTMMGTFEQATDAMLLGQELELELDDGALRFVGDITTVRQHHDSTGAQVIRVRAFDRLDRLRHRQSLHAFQDTQIGDIAASLLGEVDLLVESTGQSTRPPHRMQCQENDLEFLTRLLHDDGAMVVVRGVTALLAHDGAPLNTTSLRLGVDLTELSRSATTEGVACRVHATAWDASRAESVAAMRDASRSNAWVDLANDTAERAGERRLFDTGPLDRQTADAQAQAVLDRAASRAARFDGVATARPDLSPGVRCEFLSHDGVSLGEHTLTTVEHRVTGAGVISEFTTVLPNDLGRDDSLSAAIVTRGIIDDVDDPETRGRARVRLPAHGDALTPWIDVLLPGVNAERGLLALPEVGDVVGVAFPGGDLARGMVLGSALGPEGLAQSVRRGQRIDRQVWHSSRNQYVSLDHRAGAVVARNRAGSRLAMRSDEVELHSEGDLVIAAPGKTIWIRAAAVEFEQVT